MLDTSGSIRRDDYKKQKEFVIGVSRALGLSEDGTNYGVVLFSQFASMDIKFSDFYDQRRFEKAVYALKQYGSVTRIDLGLRKSKKLFSPAGGHRKNANKVLFLLTDGSQTKAPDAVENSKLGRNIRYDGIELHVIGIGRNVDRAELESIAGGGERAFIAKNFDELKSPKFIEHFKSSCGKLSFLYRS